MNIDDINQGIEKNKKRKRIGRGSSSGQGKTAGRGQDGAQSRSGYSRHPAFQGGAMPMVRRIPKRGFNNKFALDVTAVNVSDLEATFEAGGTVSVETLQAAGFLKQTFDELKILGEGALTKKLTVHAHRFSAQAKEKIEAVGGTVVVVPGRRTPDERVAALRGEKA